MKEDEYTYNSGSQAYICCLNASGKHLYKSNWCTAVTSKELSGEVKLLPNHVTQTWRLNTKKADTNRCVGFWWICDKGLAQARRQDLAAGGTKNQKGNHILKIQYWMYAATGGPNVKWGAPISNGGPGTTSPPAGDGSGLISRQKSLWVTAREKSNFYFSGHDTPKGAYWFWHSDTWTVYLISTWDLKALLNFCNCWKVDQLVLENLWDRYGCWNANEPAIL